MFDKSKLLPVLNSSKIQKDNPSLYQVIKDMIDGITDSLSSMSSSSSGNNTSGTIKFKQVILNNDQILALPTSPIKLITEPGNGFGINLVKATAISNTLGGAYSNFAVTGSGLSVVTSGSYPLSSATYNDAGLTITALSDFLGVVDERVVRWATFGYAEDYATANGILNYSDLLSRYNNNSAYLILSNGGSGDLLDGDPNNTLKINLYYIIEKL